MSGFLVVALWIAALTGTGTAVTWRPGRAADLAPAARLAAGWLAGQLALGAAAAGLSLAGIAWTPGRLLGGVVLVTLPAAAWAWTRRWPGAGAVSSRRPVSRLGAILLGVLALACLSVMVRQVRAPIWSNDAIAIWALKAKVFAARAALDTATLTDPGFDFAHPEYPTLWPITMAAPMVGRGFDDYATTLFAAFLTSLLVACLVGELRRAGLGASWAASLGILFLSLESLFGPFHVGLAELPLATALLVACIALARLRAAGTAAAAALAALGLTAAVLVKDEGMALLAAGAVVTLWPGRRYSFRRAALVLAPPVVVLGLSLAVRKAAGLAVHGDLAARWPGPGELSSRAVAVAGYALRQMVVEHVVVALALAAVLVLGRRAGARLGALTGFVLVAALAYLPAYLFTGRDLSWHLETTLTRIAAPFAAPILLVAGAHLTAWLEAGSRLALPDR